MTNARLMIVEDDADISNMLRIYFSSLGYSVDVAPNGNEALEKTRHLMPHLIILDIMLPDIDGYEVCRRLKADDKLKSIPVVLITASIVSTITEKMKEFKADDYLIKPFEPEQLLEKIKKFLP